MIDLVILRREVVDLVELDVVAVDLIVFDVVSEVVVATPGADHVTDEVWVCVVTGTEVGAVTPGTDDSDVLMPRVVVVVALVVAGSFSLKIISPFNDIICFSAPTP